MSAARTNPVNRLPGIRGWSALATVWIAGTGSRRIRQRSHHAFG